MRDLGGSATEQKLAICSVKIYFIKGRDEAGECGNTYSILISDVEVVVEVSGSGS